MSHEHERANATDWLDEMERRIDSGIGAVDEAMRRAVRDDIDRAAEAAAYLERFSHAYGFSCEGPDDHAWHTHRRYSHIEICSRCVAVRWKGLR